MLYDAHIGSFLEVVVVSGGPKTTQVFVLYSIQAKPAPRSSMIAQHEIS